jgi:2'-hydroxyisoflavone reductase
VVYLYQGERHAGGHAGSRVRFLVLGGTVFVGRHLVSRALQRGHDVTLFNRRRTNPSLFDGIPRLVGDRATGDLGALGTGEWDAVIDVSGRRPESVRATAEVLRDSVRTYCFVSSVAVYARVEPAWTDESSEFLAYDPAAEPLPVALAYGARKVACERMVRASYADRSLIIRPGVVVGPHDPTGRFAHWVERAARGGAVLGPARPEQPVQVIHAEDLADFVLGLLECGGAGTFNCVGPDEPATFADLLEACQTASRTRCEIMWAPDDLLHRHGVHLPLALPASGRHDGAYRRCSVRAAGQGLRNRSLTDSARSTLLWFDEEGGRRMSALPGGEQRALASLLRRSREITQEYGAAR